MKKILNEELFKKALENCGYYISCEGCDYEESYNIEGDRCTQDDMIGNLIIEYDTLNEENT